LKVTGRFVGAVQQYQSEWPPGLPAWFGSLASFVALVLRPEIVPAMPLIATQAGFARPR